VCVAVTYSQLDNDGDALIDEDPIDLLDNDGDGLIDEDPVDFFVRFVPMLDPTSNRSTPMVTALPTTMKSLPEPIPTIQRTTQSRTASLISTSIRRLTTGCGWRGASVAASQIQW